MAFLTVLNSWAPVGIWAGIIYFLSSIPSLNTGLGLVDFVLRKGAHMTEYGILTALLARAFYRTRPDWRMFRIVTLSGLFALLYAMTDEFHQHFVYGRTASVHDVVIDSCGIGLTLLILRRKYATA